MNGIHGSKTWFVADCFWPEITTEGHYVSQEAICVLNTQAQDAHIRLTLYFEDRAPMEGFEALCPARRTHHVRLDKLTGAKGNHIPMGVPYAVMVQSDVPVIVQYSRLDTTQANESLMTTMAHPL